MKRKGSKPTKRYDYSLPAQMKRANEARIASRIAIEDAEAIHEAVREMRRNREEMGDHISN